MFIHSRPVADFRVQLVSFLLIIIRLSRGEFTPESHNNEFKLAAKYFYYLFNVQLRGKRFTSHQRIIMRLMSTCGPLTTITMPKRNVPDGQTKLSLNKCPFPPSNIVYKPSIVVALYYGKSSEARKKIIQRERVREREISTAKLTN